MLISELLFIIKIVVGVGELLKLPKQRKQAISNNLKIA